MKTLPKFDFIRSDYPAVACAHLLIVIFSHPLFEGAEFGRIAANDLVWLSVSAA